MNDTKALQPYGTDHEIQQLAQRIKDCLPGGSRLQDHEALTLAQISIVYGLNPFNGEIWYIPAKGPMVGIKGLRKAARKQSGYMLRQHNMDMAQREDRLLQDGDKGATCDLYRCDLGLQMQQANIPFIGEGIARQNERAPHTKSLRWLANKRAEADALKKAFDLPFGFDESTNGASQPIPANGQALITSPGGTGGQPAHPRLAAAGSARAAAADLYGDWDGEIFAAGEDHPPADPQEEIIETTATLISDKPGPPDNGSEPDEQEPAWFRSPQAAITWGLRQGAFTGIEHARNAYKKLRKNARPKNAAEMGQLWRADVAYRLEQLASTSEA